MPAFGVSTPPATSWNTQEGEHEVSRDRPLAESVVGGGVKALFRFRGRDSGAPVGPPVYVYWSTGENPTPPYGGPIVDVVSRKVR